MMAPCMTVLPSGTFHRWMRGTGRLGDQHKVPRVMNDRGVADALLAHDGGESRRVDVREAARHASVANM